MVSSFLVRLCALVSAILMLVTLPGCGGHDFGPTGSISGRLTLDGKPMAEGHAVSFMQLEKGFLAFGFTDADGKFTVSSWNDGEMPVGKYNVMIAPPAAPDNAKEATAEEQFENPELVAPKVSSIFPVKYRDATTSGLEYEVVAGENKFEIDLQLQ